MQHILGFTNKENTRKFSKKWRPEVEKRGASSLLTEYGADAKATRFLKQIDHDIRAEKAQEAALRSGFERVIGEKKRRMF